MNLKSLVASRLTSRPWAIAPARLEALLAGTAAFTVGTERPPWLQDSARLQGYSVTESGIAIVPVLGPLVARADWLTSLLGATEYGAIADAVSAAADDPAVRGILLEVDSPGGEVGGLFDTVDTIGAIKRRSAKPLWAAASEAALSAAYAIASTSDRIYISRTGEVGSVGVVAVHLDASGADAMAGLRWTLIHAGACKTDGNPHEPLSPRATADLQTDVDALYQDLVALVAANRGVGADTVRATEAAIYRGEKALKAGLADRVGTLAQTMVDLEAALDPKRIRAGPPAKRTAVREFPSPARTLAMNTSDPLIDDTGAEPPEDATGKNEIISDLQKEGIEAPPETASADRPLAAPVPDAHALAERLRAEFSEIATVTAQAGRLGVNIDAADAMRQGLKPNALRRSVLDALAARSEAADIVAVTPATATAGDSPIVRRARERASAGR
jgi:signal peptide peptidase SppA